MVQVVLFVNKETAEENWGEFFFIVKGFIYVQKGDYKMYRTDFLWIFNAF